LCPNRQSAFGYDLPFLRSGHGFVDALAGLRGLAAGLGPEAKTAGDHRRHSLTGLARQEFLVEMDGVAVVQED